MPQYIPPRNAGVHRVAAIGLFRALLSQSRRIPFKEPELTLLGNVIRHKFKQKRYEQSKRCLTLAWQAGYEALDLFDKCMLADPLSLERTRRLLHQTPKHLTCQPALAPLLPKAKPRPLLRSLPRESILLRPRPVVSGRRRIPVLTFGNKIPFLRIKKPQPHALGALLRKRERVQMARVFRLEYYESMIATGAHEDNWDKLILAEGTRCAPSDETSKLRSTMSDVSWRQAYVDARAVVKTDQRRWVRKKLDHGMKLLRIVEEEKKLAEKERIEWRQEAWRNRIAKKAETARFSDRRLFSGRPEGSSSGA